MSTLSVKIERILEVQPHPNADRLDLVTVLGWQCVTAKGVFKSGDLCAYFPIDSILPEKVEAVIFGPDSKVKLDKHRVRTIKLRGAISQGMAISLPTLQDAGVLSLHHVEGHDVTQELGVTKYEPPVTASTPQAAGVPRKKLNSNFHKYTGIENGKNYPELFEQGERVVVSEKLHGTNARYGWVKFEASTLWKKILQFFKLAPEYEFVFGSHNVQLQDSPFDKTYYGTNVYAKMISQYNLKEVIPKGYALYGEIVGDGIQKGYSYGCKPGEHRLYLFDIMKDGTYLDDAEFVQAVVDLNLPKVPVIYRGPYNKDKIKELVSGSSILDPSQHVREGIVVKPVKEQKTYMGRKIVKLINEEYLLNKSNTEWH